MASTPASLCLLRLSALGDVTHVVPLVRTLQAGFPASQLHWIIDKAGLKLLDGLPGVQFHAYDKRTGVAGMRALRQSLAPLGRFDALLQMQVAFRANVLSAFVPARRRIGYDRSRSKDLHGLFVNERIADRPGIHVARRYRQLRAAARPDPDPGALGSTSAGRGACLGACAVG